MSFRDTRTQLRGFGKPAAGAPAYSRFVNRPAGRWIAATAYHLGLTPNQVTAISGLFSLGAIVVLLTAPITVTTGVVVAALLAVGYAFDSADGQLARLRGGGSPQGEWLDHVVDCVKISALHLSVFVALSRSEHHERWAVLALLWVLVGNTFFFTFIATDLLGRVERARAGTAPPPPRQPSTVRSLLSVPTDYGLLCVAFLLWGFTHAFLVAYGLLLAGTAGYLLLGLPKWFKDMGRLRGA